MRSMACGGRSIAGVIRVSTAIRNEKGGVEEQMGWYRPNCLVRVPEAKRGQFVATSPSQSCAIRARLRMAGELRMPGRGTRSITGNFQSAKLISSISLRQVADDLIAGRTFCRRYHICNGA